MKRLAGIAAVLLVATAQSQTPETAAPRAPPAPADAPPAVAAKELATATSILRDAWKDFTQCRRPSACNAYFETFGVAISFADGSIAPFARAARLKATSHDCVKNARVYLEQGNRSLAVQWAMAARIEDLSARDWLGNHPEAVLAALRNCCH